MLKNIIRKAEKNLKNGKGGENWGRNFFGVGVLFGGLPPKIRDEWPPSLKDF